MLHSSGQDSLCFSSEPGLCPRTPLQVNTKHQLTPEEGQLEPAGVRVQFHLNAPRVACPLPTSVNGVDTAEADNGVVPVKGQPEHPKKGASGGQRGGVVEVECQHGSSPMAVEGDPR